MDFTNTNINLAYGFSSRWPVAAWMVSTLEAALVAELVELGMGRKEGSFAAIGRTEMPESPEVAGYPVRIQGSVQLGFSNGDEMNASEAFTLDTNGDNAGKESKNLRGYRQNISPTVIAKSPVSAETLPDSDAGSRTGHNHRSHPETATAAATDKPQAECLKSPSKGSKSKLQPTSTDP